MKKNPVHPPPERASQVNSMFSRVAVHYDRMNRLMSLGREFAWRRRAVRLAALPRGGRLLDVAIGTGAMALTALECDPSLGVTGVDFNVEMMQIGRWKEKEHRRQASLNGGLVPTSIRWVNGDGLRLPYPGGTFDAAISGFMMRNVDDVAIALAEQRRVVRRGGRVVCLELTQPTLPLWRQAYRLIFGEVMPFITGWLSGQPGAYRYLPASVDNFVSVGRLKAIMEAVGLRGVGYQTMMLGTVAIHVGVK
jgi:demethylmenaquinone methyltransferase/2-methoxy-6-polyprenyl-1,4-benzoquinol methylase